MFHSRIFQCLAWCAMFVPWPFSLGLQNARGDLLLIPTLSTAATSDADTLVHLVIARRFDQARKLLDDIKLKTSDAPHREVMLAELLMQHGMLMDGKQILESLANTDPNRFDVRFLFCKLAVEEKRWLEATWHANVAAGLPFPQEWSSKYRESLSQQLTLLQGLSCEGREDWSEAAMAYDSIPPEPPCQPALMGLGRVAFYRGDATQALKFFRQAAQLDSNSESAELRLATMYEQQGEQEEAEKWLREAAAKGSQAELARFKLAHWLINANRPNEVREILEGPLSKPDLESERQFLAALVARMQGRHADAQRLLSQLHQTHLSSSTVSNHLALALIENADEAARMRALQIAQLNVRNQPQSAEAWSTLGWIQLRLGDLATAEECLLNSLRSGQASRDTAYYLANLYQATGREGQAEELRAKLAQASGPFFYNWSSHSSTLSN